MLTHPIQAIKIETDQRRGFPDDLVESLRIIKIKVFIHFRPC